MAGWFILGALLIIGSQSAAECKRGAGESGKTRSPGADAGKNKDDVSLKYEFKNALILNYTALQKLKNSASVGVAFFFSRRFTAPQQFFLEYDKSAAFLNAYGIPLGVVDCTAGMPDLKDVCATESKRSKVVAYRLGEEMLALDLDVMFDVNSIMSNILQLALLNEVSIISNKDDRKRMEIENHRKKDAIFSYHAAIGTYEHRVFMEVAFAYRDKYKFYVTTALSSIAGLHRDSMVNQNTMCAVWMLYCREKYDLTNGCHSIIYRGPLTLQGFASYVRSLSQPLVFYYPQDGLKLPCETAADKPCIYIRHSPSTKAIASAVVDSIRFDVHAIAGLVVEEKDLSVVPPLTSDPQISLSKPGMEKHIVMDQEWTLENVQGFISSHLFNAETKPTGEVTASVFSDQNQNSSLDTVTDIDDMVMYIAIRTKDISEEVPELTDISFPEAVAKSKLLVVYFYLPFDSRSKVFLQELEEAASKLMDLQKDPPLAHPLAQVNCFDWTDVCQKENITTYPVLRIYRNGQKQEYNEILDKDVLVRTIRLLQMEQPLVLRSVKEVTDFLSGHSPEGAEVITDDLVLFRPSSSSMEEMEDYGSVVKSLENRMLFAVVDPQVDTEQVSRPSLVHVRLSDRYMPREILHNPSNVDSMKSFLVNGQFHLLPELTHLNFPALYAKKQPFGILFIKNDGVESEMLQDSVVAIIKEKRFPEVIFCKMNVDDEDSVSSSILQNYLGSHLVPSFVIVWHEKGKVFAQDGTDLSKFSEEALSLWIRSVLDGSEMPFKDLRKGEWKPRGGHYDFLALIDHERQLKRRLEGPPSQYPPAICEDADCDGVMQGTSETPQKDMTEAEDIDSDIRATMLELQNSRLYSGKERRSHGSPSAQHSSKGEAAASAREKAEMRVQVEATQQSAHTSDFAKVTPAVTKMEKKMDRHSEL